MEYSKRSKEILSDADANLQKVFMFVIKLGLVDITIIQSTRSRSEQERLYNIGKSKVQWPNSKHNHMPSKAIDAAPYVDGKVSWDTNHCIFLAGIVCAVGASMGIKIRWGGNWDMDGEPITDQDFQDLVHYEIGE